MREARKPKTDLFGIRCQKNILTSDIAVRQEKK